MRGSSFRDGLWLALAMLFLIWVSASAVVAIRRFFERPDPLAILGFTLLVLVASWLVAGAWLRTSWGRRFLKRRRGPDRTSPTQPNGSTPSR